jgi:radical SAM superfamily enzyme YgiQ (UPF0313 family)
MKISLASSIHLDHGGMTPDKSGGAAIPMMSFVPVGLLSLKAYADQLQLGADIRVTEVNGLINAGKIPNDDEFYEHLVDTFLARDDDFVGLMTDADSLHHTVILAQRVKSRRPDVKVCLGGPASSPMASVLLNTFPFIDYIVRSEGEETFGELIEHFQGKRRLNDILGLTWRDGERAVDNAPRHMADDLDRLPIPAFDAYDMMGGAPLYLDVGRGCPFSCAFCATAPFWKRQYRMKSTERIVEEALLIRDVYKRNKVNFSHDIFTCDRAWTLEFCEYLIQNPLHMEWTCSTRTDVIDDEVLDRLAAAGCVEIYYGIETGSQELQKTIDKSLDLEWSRHIVEKTAAAGIRPVTGFILGYPFETRRTLADTLKRFFEYLEVGGFRAHLFTLSPFPESPMFRKFGVPHLDRPAEYYDLPLTAQATEPGQTLKQVHRDLFASTYRYRTPEVASRLVDASEEVSTRISMLRSLWPHLLKHYDSPLDFFERWVDWIEVYNDQRRPGTSFRHQADADDLLTFVGEEIERLEIRSGALLDLVRYEKMKLDGRFLPPPKHVGVPTAEEIGPDTFVVQNTGWLASEFDHDIQSLLGHRSLSEARASAERRWVVVYKTADDQLTTLQVGDRTWRLLESTREPIQVQSLITGVTEAHGEAGREVNLAAVQKLAHIGLLCEVPPS